MKDVIYKGDALCVLSSMEPCQFDMCVTSPPYFGLRDYGVDGQIGLEQTPDEYITKLVEVFREVRRVLRDDGTIWVNVGDSYAGSSKGTTRGISKDTKRKHTNGTALKRANQAVDGLKPKDLIGIPWMLAFALRADGWYLRQDIIWAKPNPIPESVKDRCTKSHEYIFLLSKSRQYYYDADAIKEEALSCDANTRDRETTKLNNCPGRTKMGGLTHNEYTMKNKRDVWNVPTKPSSVAHFAVYPEDLIRPCILAGCPEGGTVLDPFFGSGTTGAVCIQEGRNYCGIELNQEYIDIAEHRLVSEKNKRGFTLLEEWNMQISNKGR